MRSSKSNILAVAIGAAIVSGTAFAGGRSAEVLAAIEAGRADYATGELIVQYAASASSADRDAIRRGLGAHRLESLHERLEVLKIPVGLSIASAIRAIDSDPAVDFAEPNWVYTHSATSNDTLYTNGSLWGMYSATTSPANAFGSGAAAAWAGGKTNCSSAIVGIIDEGYMFTHSDLAANAFQNPGEAGRTPGVDDDGNGLIDDIHGWDFDGNNNTVFDGVGDDHGTHVAGTIGGKGGNGAGVAGVCWDIKLMSAKFLGSRGGTTANAVKAVDYFTDLKTRHGLNIVATNNSWGGGGYSQALADAIERANQQGILFVAAAGNSAVDCGAADCYPAEYANANVIGVASITSTGAMSSFSSFGATTIDIGAPGSGIWSTVPTQSRRNAPITSGYASYNGTSMATPHVAGAVALFAGTRGLAPRTAADAAAIKAAILNSATPTTSLNGRVLSNGRLNVSGF